MAADEPDSEVTYWLQQIDKAQRDHQEWHQRGQDVMDRYLDKKRPQVAGNDTQAHTMNVLWSNVQTIQPALYAKTPKPNVQRRFKDKDPIGRWAATVLERAESYELDAYDDDYHFRQAALDYLLPGRGQVWVSYEPKIVKNGGVEAIEWECCRVRHLHWKDFLTNKARTWDEVTWVAKREYFTKQEAKAAGLETKKLTFSEQPEDGSDRTNSANKAAIWEIWDKLSNKVYLVTKNSPEFLRKPAPPGLKLDGFFPCPRPLTTTVTTDSIIPVPDYCQYQNQAQEIDRLTQKINLLTKSLRVAGIYDGTQDSLGRLLEDTTQNIMIPCENWAVLSAQKGLDGSVSWFPLDMIIKALEASYRAREQAKAAMYEITGFSDIVRGASQPNETATAQQIKSQWGGLRIRDRQHEVQRFIRDVIRIKAEIYAEVFQSETLKSMSNVPLATEQEKAQLQRRQQMSQQAMQMAQQNPQEAQAIVQQNPQIMEMLKPLTPEETRKLKEPSWDQVFGLLRDQRLRGFRIDIETDSTIMADEAEEKQARTEFLGAMTNFAQAWGQIIMSEPKAAPLAGEMMMFGARAFKTADAVESAIDEFVDALAERKPAQPPPDPAAMAKAEAAKAKVDEVKAKGQIEGRKMQSDMQMAQGNALLEREKMDLEREKMALEREKMGLEYERLRVEREALNKPNKDD